MKKIAKITAALSVALGPILAWVPAYATSGSVYLSPSSGSVTNGTTVSVGVYEDSGTTTINSIQANLSFPSSLSYISTTTPSNFSDCQTTASSGLLQLCRFVLPTGSTLTGAHLLATVTFKATASSGTAAVGFASGTEMPDASTSQAMTLSESGASFTLKAPATAPSGGSTTKSPSSSTSSTKLSSSSTSSTSTSSSSSPSSKSSPKKPTPKKPSVFTLSGVAAENITANSATVTWETSSPTSSEVDYGVSSGSYLLKATAKGLATKHKVVLGQLSPGGLYHFQVKSTDANQQAVASDDAAFTTKGATVVVTVLDQNHKPVVGATVTFTTVTGTGKVSSMTDKDGHAALTGLPVGKLSGKVTYKGVSTPIDMSVGPVDKDGKSIGATDGVQTVSFTIKVPKSSLGSLLPVAIGLIVLIAAAYALVRTNLLRKFTNRNGGNGNTSPPSGMSGSSSVPPSNSSVKPPSPSKPGTAPIVSGDAASGNVQAQPTVIQPTAQKPPGPQPPKV